MSRFQPERLGQRRVALVDVAPFLQTWMDMSGGGDTERWGRHVICRGQDGAPVPLPRAPGETVLLGCLPGEARLVELHFVHEGESLPAFEKLSFQERTESARSLSGAGFVRLLESGEEEGRLAYVTEVCDGEYLAAFLERAGPLEAPLALSLTLRLTETLLDLQPSFRLFLAARLGPQSLLVTLAEDGSLTPRLMDLGLARREPRQSPDLDLQKTASEIVGWLRFMLSGRNPAPGGAAEDAIAALSGVGDDLKSLLGDCLRVGRNTPEDLETLRARLLACLETATGSRDPQAHLLVAPRLFPLRSLAEALAGGDFPLPSRFRLPHAGEAAAPLPPWPLLLSQTRPAGRLSAMDEETGDRVALQWLPPQGVLPLPDAGPELIRPKAEEVDGLVRCVDFLNHEASGTRVLAEEAVNGFTLGDCLSARSPEQPLSSAEILLLLRGTRFCLSQAAEAALPVHTLSPHSLHFHFPEADPATLEALPGQPLPLWPECHMKLRCHPVLADALRVPREPDALHQPPQDSGQAEERLALSYLGLARELLRAARSDAAPWLEEARQPNGTSLADFDYDAFLAELERRL